MEGNLKELSFHESINCLVSNNGGLIGKEVKNFDQELYPYDELCYYGSVGLAKAAQAFDSNRGVKFSTYATRCIRNEILMYVDKLERRQIAYFEDVIADDSQGNSLNLLDSIFSVDNDFVDESEKSFQDNVAFEKLFTILLNNFSMRNLYICSCVLCGQKHKDIADMFEMSRSTVSVTFGRVLKEMKKYYFNNLQFTKNFWIKKDLSCYHLFILIKHHSEIIDLIKEYFKRNNIQKKYELKEHLDSVELIMYSSTSNFLLITMIVNFINRFKKYMKIYDDISEITYDILYEDQMKEYQEEVARNKNSNRKKSSKK